MLLAIALCVLCTKTVIADTVHIVTEEFPPYNYQEDSNAKGLSTEVIQAVLQEIDVQAEINFYPWARAYKIAQQRKNHLIYSIVRIPEREEQFQWVGKIAPYSTSLYKLKSNTNIKVHTLSDAKNYLVGVSREDVITTYLRRKGFVTFDISNHDSINIKKLLSGRVDLIAYDDASFVYIVRSMGLDLSKFEKINPLLELSGSLYMAFNKNSDTELVNKFRAGLQSIKENGLYDEIQRRYFLLN
ncbi:substrate-binding periplasmic protein [Kiloniella sp.]|uniref:substrate-binding periplasmic protein n=1 Tax=Kiloniella sp. TaxID=1938587 RepID=UPI003B021408